MIHFMTRLKLRSSSRNKNHSSQFNENIDLSQVINTKDRKIFKKVINTKDF